MDIKELKGLVEAYQQVHVPQEEIEIDEALTGERYRKVIKKPGGTAYSRKVSADPTKRATRGGRGGESDFGAGDRGSGNKAARRAGKSVYDTRYEEVDVFDVVLEFLQAEGFAENLEEAQDIMVNELDADDIEAIVEATYSAMAARAGIDEGAAGDVAARAQKLANQKKNQTPERKKMYQGLADRAAERERGPFKRGTSRQGMTPSERTRSREAAAYQADVYGGSATYGKGSLPKGKKLERQRARGVSEKFEA